MTIRRQHGRIYFGEDYDRRWRRDLLEYAKWWRDSKTGDATAAPLWIPFAWAHLAGKRDIDESAIASALESIALDGTVVR